MRNILKKALKYSFFALLGLLFLAFGGGNALAIAIPNIAIAIALILLIVGIIIMAIATAYLGAGMKGDVVIGDNNNIYKPTTNLIEHHFHVDSPQQLGPRVDKETQKWLSGSSSRQS